MFRNKILMRAEPPASFSSSPFFLSQLSIDSPPLLSVELETLCCKLSQKWRLACFHESSEIFIIYQRVQSDSAACVIKELIGSLSIRNVGTEEEVKAASLIARSIECVLRYVMLNNNWRCVGDKSFVESSFACCEERNHLLALNVGVQLESDGSLVFLISPDILRFSRYKISELLNSGMMQSFDDGKEVTLEVTNLVMACTILPYLYEGYVTGLSKSLPAGENFDGTEELWSFKYGLALSSNYFIQVQLSIGGVVNKQWYPSSIVLQGSGLTTAPQTIRALKAMHAVESFIRIAEAWNFFDRGLLIVKDISPLASCSSQPLWKTISNNFMDWKTTNNSTHDTYETTSEKLLLSKDLLNLDFRTPKPHHGLDFSKRTSVHAGIPGNAKSSLKIHPHFTKRIGNADILYSTNKSSLPVMKHVPITQGAPAVKSRTPILDHALLTQSTPKPHHGLVFDKRAEIPETTKSSLMIGSDHITRVGNADILYSANKSSLPVMKHVPVTQDAPDCAESRCLIGKLGEKQTSDEACRQEVEVSCSQDKKNNLQNTKEASGCLVGKLGEKNSDEACRWEVEVSCFQDKRSNLHNTAEAKVYNQKEGTSIQMGGGNSRGPKISRKNEMTEAFKLGNSLTVPGKVPLFESLGNSTSHHETKSQDDTVEVCNRAKLHVDRANISTKITDCYIRGELQSLTVAHLKCFLSMNKAKVGGKKEELIQRITTLLA